MKPVQVRAAMSQNTYHINDIFYSLQGEGMRAGTANLFLRFAGCNLACDLDPGTRSPGGFACDTEFVSQVSLTIQDILARFQELAPSATWVICTGGEPGLQLDQTLIDACHTAGYRVAIETNGTVSLDALGLDWICVSPKVAEHALKQFSADEVKYVRNYGQGIPKPAITASHYLISPAFHGDTLDTKTLRWCIQLVLENPPWRLSMQAHKLWSIR
jgi:organic radical activating enzyme